MRAAFLLIGAAFLLNGKATAAVGHNVRNLNPTALLYGLPGATPGQLPTTAGGWRYSMDLDVVSHFLSQTRGSENLVLDGETLALTLSFRQRSRRGWHWGLAIPLIQHSGGALDATVDGWHELLGAPDGGRNKAPRNRLRYRYIRDGQRIFQLQQSRSGIGDLRLLLGRDWRQANGRGLVAQLQLKAPTGRVQRFTGSEAWDAGAGLYWQSAEVASGLRQGGMLGASWLGRGKLLPWQQRRYAVSAGWQLSWRARSRPWWRVIGQLQGHSALYRDTGIRTLERYALQGSLLLERRLRSGASLQIGITEDLVVRTSPDFQLHLSFYAAR